jgi:mannose-6-phosphate isomerase-like protein (cupin superfamily)
MRAPDVTTALRAQFESKGFVGPVRLLTEAECAIIARYLDEDARPKPSWLKGLAVADPVLYEVAVRPEIVSIVADLIGPDVNLWGVSFVDRSEGQAHPWHTDIETSASGMRSVSIWIGLRNTSANSSLNVISGSHRYGMTVQQAAHERSLPRELRSADATLGLARMHDPHAELVRPDMGDGEAIVFDGRLWHGTLNTRPQGCRRALLLQYAAASSPIRIPNYAKLDWPIAASPVKAPVISVHGKPRRWINRIVDPPPRSSESTALRPLTRVVPWPLPRDASGWKPTPLYRGTTAALRHIGCHASSLRPGHSPHPPHAHLDEEFLFILDGEADVIIAQSPEDPSPRAERLKAGDFVYYPPYQHHTIRAAGDNWASYLMYRWQGALRETPAPLPTAVYRLTPETEPAHGPAFSTRVLFEGPTVYLDKLHIHASRVERNGGYAPHADDYDVAILLLSGAVETLGRTIAAPAVVFYPAHAIHGLKGVSEEPARYYVVEFHACGAARRTDLELRLRQAVRSARGRIKDRLRPLWHRVRHQLPLRRGAS